MDLRHEAIKELRAEALYPTKYPVHAYYAEQALKGLATSVTMDEYTDYSLALHLIAERNPLILTDRVPDFIRALTRYDGYRYTSQAATVRLLGLIAKLWVPSRLSEDPPLDVLFSILEDAASEVVEAVGEVLVVLSKDRTARCEMVYREEITWAMQVGLRGTNRSVTLFAEVVAELVSMNPGTIDRFVHQGVYAELGAKLVDARLGRCSKMICRALFALKHAYEGDMDHVIRALEIKLVMGQYLGDAQTVEWAMRCMADIAKVMDDFSSARRAFYFDSMLHGASLSTRVYASQIVLAKTPDNSCFMHKSVVAAFCACEDEHYLINLARIMLPAVSAGKFRVRVRKSFALVRLGDLHGPLLEELHVRAKLREKWMPLKRALAERIDWLASQGITAAALRELREEL